MTKGASVITMTYTADGEKLSKAVTGGGATKNYVGGIEYAGANLEAIYFGEGRCTPNGATAFNYDYTVKDHLGNARVNFRANGTAITVLESMHYYPFGMLMEGIGTNTPTNDYTYNYKELNDDFGLNLYDYGARWYDASLGRWWSVDPMGEEYYPFSPYNYVANNPMLFMDGDGTTIVDGNGNPITYSEKDGKLEWSENATEATKEIGNAMWATPSGQESLNNLQALSTTVEFALTDGDLVDAEGKIVDASGMTEALDAQGNPMPSSQQFNDANFNENGEYKSIRISITTKSGTDDSKDRFANTDRDEKLNAVGVHEEGHTRKGEIKKERENGVGIEHYSKFLMELQTRFEFENNYPDKAKPSANYINNYTRRGTDAALSKKEVKDVKSKADKATKKH